MLDFTFLKNYEIIFYIYIINFLSFKGIFITMTVAINIELFIKIKYHLRKLIKSL